MDGKVLTIKEATAEELESIESMYNAAKVSMDNIWGYVSNSVFQDDFLIVAYTLHKIPLLLNVIKQDSNFPIKDRKP